MQPYKRSFHASVVGLLLSLGIFSTLICCSMMLRCRLQPRELQLLAVRLSHDEPLFFQYLRQGIRVSHYDKGYHEIAG
jgi:hypothetical protein